MRRKNIFLVSMLLVGIHYCTINVEVCAQETLGEKIVKNKEEELLELIPENDGEAIKDCLQDDEQFSEESNNNPNHEEMNVEVISPIYRVHNQAYGRFVENAFPYSSDMGLDVPIYDYGQSAQYLPRVYIIIPDGTKLSGGLDSLQIELDKYLIVNKSIMGGQLIASRLANAQNGREVYQITPTEGTYIGGELQDRNLHLKVEAPGKKSDIDKISINANKTGEVADFNILFFGYDKKNLSNINGLNPILNAASCGIVGSDEEVATSVSANYRQEVSFYIQKIKDSYSLWNRITGNFIAEKSIDGDFGDVYNRDGFINSMELWGLQPNEYAQETLAMEVGDINGLAVFSTEARNPKEIVEGNNYSLLVNKYAGDIEIRFVDLEGENIVPKEFIKGFVGQEYATQAKEVPGWLLETELPENQHGVFSDESVIVTYKYDRKNGEAVTVRYLDEENNDLINEEVLHGKVGLDYITKAKSIEGWEIKQSPLNAIGKFMEVSQEVIYVYTAKTTSPHKENKEKNSVTKDTNLNKAKPSEKNNGILPRTGEQNANQSKLIGVSLIFILVSSICFFKKLKVR